MHQNLTDRDGREGDSRSLFDRPHPRRQRLRHRRSTCSGCPHRARPGAVRGLLLLVSGPLLAWLDAPHHRCVNRPDAPDPAPRACSTRATPRTHGEALPGGGGFRPSMPHAAPCSGPPSVLRGFNFELTCEIKRFARGQARGSNLGFTCETRRFARARKGAITLAPLPGQSSHQARLRSP